MDQKPSKITLLWVPSHVRIPGKKTADEADDIIKVMKNKKQEKWERSTSTMKERKPFFEKNTNMKIINGRGQDAVTPDLPTPQL
jgi:hypothetical protein